MIINTNTNTYNNSAGLIPSFSTHEGSIHPNMKTRTNITPIAIADHGPISHTCVRKNIIIKNIINATIKITARSIYYKK